MTAILKRIDDPRDALERTRRLQLVAYARANNVPNITGDTPAILIRARLRERGLTRPTNVTFQPLGQPERPAPRQNAAVVPESPRAIDMVADLERQFAAEPPAPLPSAPKSAAHMTIIELGNEMKRLKIKRDRKDNMITMRAKIEQHGKPHVS